MTKDAPEQKDAPQGEDWAAVSMAFIERMHDRGLTPAEIHRQTGMSQRTIYAVINKDAYSSNRTKSTLALLSAVLELRLDHFYNILHGRADKNVVPESAMEKKTAQILLELNSLAALQREVAVLKEAVQGIDEKLDTVLTGRYGGPSDAQGPRPDGPGAD